MLKIEECSACGERRYIVNRKHMCCGECNKIRIHGADAIKEKKEKYLQSMRKVKNSNKIKQKSSKQMSIDDSYKDVKMELINEAQENETYYCRGCGNPANLSLSHLIRRSRRPDLTDVKENMTFHCLVRQDDSTGCHDMWETMEHMIELEDFDDNMSIVRRLDPEYYWIIVNKLREMGYEINVDSHK